MSGAGEDAARLSSPARLQSDSDSRLQTTRNHHSVCGIVLHGREDLQPNGQQTHAPAVAGISKATRSRNAAGFDASFDRRQLLHAQTREGEVLDGLAQPKTAEGSWRGPRRDAFHAYFQFVDKSGRAILPRPN